MNDMSTSHIRQLDGTLLLVFRELLRERRATTAAAHLGLTQSGISHVLNRLRLLFGDELFLRRPHGLEPTPRALELAPQLDAMIALAQEALTGRALFEPRASRRQFRIGAPDFMTLLLAAPLLKRIKTEAPETSVAFTPLLGSTALDAVRRGDIDLAVGRLRKTAPPLLHARLFRDSYAVVGRAQHPELRRKLTEQRYAALEHVQIASAERPAGRRVFAVAPHFLAAFAIVAESDAVVVAPRPLAARYAKGFGLAVVPAPVPLPPLDIFLVYRKAKTPDAAVAWLAACVRAAVRDAGG